jgi:hypothetical protein
MRVIDTAFVYYLTWHGEKNRGTELKPRVAMTVPTWYAVACESYLATPSIHPVKPNQIQWFYCLCVRGTWTPSTVKKRERTDSNLTEKPFKNGSLW